RVLVKLKKNILDPQGSAIKKELDSLGYEGIKDVRMGKIFDVTFEEGIAPTKKEEILKEISDRLLSNPVTEDYIVE
ncbi:MAG: phosphoribosylformylglycinamidine synthase subunit PurS, partial [Spirochaetes bacterium]|nr:phosphoribosylformylglycinamidine synthase subunit PurS [Spirochaetota bacterium]